MFVQNLKEMKFMSTPTVVELQKELNDLKIRVNNLEKKMSTIAQKPRPSTSTHKFI